MLNKPRQKWIATYLSKKGFSSICLTNQGSHYFLCMCIGPFQSITRALLEGPWLYDWRLYAFCLRGVQVLRMVIRILAWIRYTKFFAVIRFLGPGYTIVVSTLWVSSLFPSLSCGSTIQNRGKACLPQMSSCWHCKGLPNITAMYMFCVSNYAFKELLWPRAPHDGA